jgi:probable F420-dependent oxidoreductase
MAPPLALGVLVSPRDGHLTDPAHVRALAARLEDAGCESVWLGDHPARVGGAHGGFFPSALEWLTFVAAHTTTLKLGAVVVVTYQHPVVLAKRIATLDRLSRGRMIIGAGIGDGREEAAALGVDVEHRAAVANEAIEVMRTIWTADAAASFDGRFFSFRGVDPEPRPWQPGGPPILIGGSSVAAARRAGRLGHGLLLRDRDPERARSLLEVARTEAVHGGWDATAIALTVPYSDDVSQLRLLRDAGATRVVLPAPRSGDLDELDERLSSARHALAAVDEAEPAG